MLVTYGYYYWLFVFLVRQCYHLVIKLGKMNLDNSWRLDRVIEIAENLGIYQLLCLTNQTNFNGGWKTNVFNKANGGILDSPREYFTSDLAMKYLEKRFRYIVARWGYSTSVFSWNLWNE